MLKYRPFLDELVQATERGIALASPLAEMANLHARWFSTESEEKELRRFLKLKKDETLDVAVERILLKFHKNKSMQNDAVRCGLTEVVRAFLPSINIDRTDSNDSRLIEIAVEASQVEVLKLLLDQGADIGVGKSDANPLHIAVRRSTLEVVKILVDREVDVQEKGGGYNGDLTVLEAAQNQYWMNRNPETGLIVEFLKTRFGPLPGSKIGKKPDSSREKRARLSQDSAARLADQIASRMRRSDPQDRNLGRYPDPIPSIVRASGSEKASELVIQNLWKFVPPRRFDREMWLNEGPSCIYKPFEAPGFVAWEELYWDIFSEGWVDVVEAMLELGLDPNQNFGYGTLLHFAFRNNPAYEMVKLLIERGASADEAFALHEAVFDERRTLQLLLASGADPNKRFEEGINMEGTPLIHLLFFGNTFGTYTPEHLGYVEDLVRAGADVNAKDSSGKSVIRYARESGDEKLVDFLIRSGARTRTVRPAR